MDSGQSCVIDNCKALNSTALSGIYLNNSLGLGTKNIIRNCISAHNEQAGIAVYSGKNLIEGNIIYRNNTQGIYIGRKKTSSSGISLNRTPVMGFGLAQPTVITTLFRAIMFLLMSIMEFTCPAPATTIPLSETMSGDDNEPKNNLK